MIEKEKIILKINNLLALSKNNKNLNESTAATLKAKELMQKHNLSEAVLEIQSEKLDGKRIIDSIRNNNQALNIGKIEEWQACLANVVCNNSGCRCYLTTIDNNGIIEEAVSVIGFEKDVKFVFALYAFLSLELASLAGTQTESANDLYKESFILGAIKKIDVRLKEATNHINEEFRRTTNLKKSHAENAIAIINSKVKNIDLYISRLNLKNNNKVISDNLAFGKGYVKGDSIDLMQHAKIEK